ncbi:phosphotransferase family protein [Ralstonia pseudosolanacearum]
MTSLEGLNNLKCLLDEHGISMSNWVEMSQRGFSGARIYMQSSHDGTSHVVKVTSAETDWIMRATSDQRCREAILANAGFAQDIRSPAIGSARDGATFSILMHDVSQYLLSNGPLTTEQLKTLLLGIARLHALTPPSECDVPWCSIEDRLTLFMPDPERLAQFRIGQDILKGWDIFFDYVPKNIADLVRALFDDIGPLKRALDQLPNSLLHGDLKLDNIGILPDGTLSLIDWSMPMVAPAAVELGWFLAMNSRTLPVSLDEAIAVYTSFANLDSRLHERHRSLTILCGLLIRGWRKALDAESGEPSELRWWCERAAAAAKTL